MSNETPESLARMDAAFQAMGEEIDQHLVTLVDKYIARGLTKDQVVSLFSFVMLDYGTVLAKARRASLENIIERVTATFTRLTSS